MGREHSERERHFKRRWRGRNHPYCPTGKATFQYRTEASTALPEAMRQTGNPHLELYRCRACRMWHHGTRRDDERE